LDGDLDIVLGAEQTLPTVLRNNGDGSFAEFHPFRRPRLRIARFCLGRHRLETAIPMPALIDDKDKNLLEHKLHLFLQRAKRTVLKRRDFAFGLTLS